MKNEWARMPLDEAVFMQEGPGIRSYEYQKDGFPMINVRCVQNGYIDLSTSNSANIELANGKWKHFQVEEGDILFTISGSIGRTAIVKKADLPLLMNTSVVRFRSKTADLRNDYFYYYLQTDSFLDRLHYLSSGTAQKNVGPTHLKTMDVPIPPIAEQKRIVAILNKAFESISVAISTAERNLKSAREIFESHLHKVFTNRGSGWIRTTIGAECILRSGTTLPKNLEKSSGEIPYLKVADMNIHENLNRITCSSRYVDRIDVNPSNLLPIGTTIFPKRGGAILTNKKRLTDRVICTDLNIMGVTPRGKLLSELLYFYFLNVDMRELGNGSSIPQINNYDIEPLQISFPGLASEQSRLVKQLDSLSRETRNLEAHYEQKVAALNELKKSILSQAFSGRL